MKKILIIGSITICLGCSLESPHQGDICPPRGDYNATAYTYDKEKQPVPLADKWCPDERPICYSYTIDSEMFGNYYCMKQCEGMMKPCNGTCIPLNKACVVDCKNGYDPDGSCACPETCANGCDRFGACLCHISCENGCDSTGEVCCPPACQNGCDRNGECACPKDESGRSCMNGCDASGLRCCPNECKNGCTLSGTCSCPDNCTNGCDSEGANCLCPDACVYGCDENGSCLAADSCIHDEDCTKLSVCRKYNCYCTAENVCALVDNNHNHMHDKYETAIKQGEPCKKYMDCDSTPGADDGFCDSFIGYHCSTKCTSDDQCLDDDEFHDLCR